MSPQCPKSQEQPKMVAPCPLWLWGYGACPQLPRATEVGSQQHGSCPRAIPDSLVAPEPDQ